MPLIVEWCSSTRRVHWTLAVLSLLFWLFAAWAWQASCMPPPRSIIAQRVTASSDPTDSRRAFPIGFSRDGTTFVTSEVGRMTFWNTLENERKVQWREKRPFGTLEVATDGKLCAVELTHRVAVWDSVTEQEWEAGDGLCRCLAYTPQTRKLLIVSGDNDLSMWDVDTRQAILNVPKAGDFFSKGVFGAVKGWRHHGRPHLTFIGTFFQRLRLVAPKLIIKPAIRVNPPLRVTVLTT